MTAPDPNPADTGPADTGPTASTGEQPAAQPATPPPAAEQPRIAMKPTESIQLNEDFGDGGFTIKSDD